MDYALWLSGSSYTVGDAEGPNPSNPASPEPPQSTSILPKPLGSSSPRASRICPRPLSLSVLHFKHSVDTGTEEQSNRRINPSLNTLQHAGGPGSVKYTVPRVPMSGDPKALSSSGPKSRGPRAPKSIFFFFFINPVDQELLSLVSLVVWVVLGPGLSSPSIPEVSCSSSFSVLHFKHHIDTGAEEKEAKEE